MVRAEWDALAARFPAVRLDMFVVMPNHIHGIFIVTVGALVAAHTTPTAAHTTFPAIRPTPPAGDPMVATGDVTVATGDARARINANVRAATRAAPTVGDIVGAYKSITTVEYIRGVHAHGWPRFRDRLWQRNYYERVIRDGDALDRMREYIARNPERWATDRENPASRRSRRWKRAEF